jgi:hypothetical protein
MVRVTQQANQKKIQFPTSQFLPYTQALSCTRLFYVFLAVKPLANLHF